jgi:orotate phosphoribosyltransferase-like protein
VDDLLDKIEELLDDGWTIIEIAAELAVDIEVVRSVYDSIQSGIDWIDDII